MAEIRVSEDLKIDHDPCLEHHRSGFSGSADHPGQRLENGDVGLIWLNSGNLQLSDRDTRHRQSIGDLKRAFERMKGDKFSTGTGDGIVELSAKIMDNLTVAGSSGDVGVCTAPGVGDVDHISLVESKAHLSETPSKVLIEKGMKSVVNGHLSFPEMGILDHIQTSSSDNLPVSKIIAAGSCVGKDSLVSCISPVEISVEGAVVQTSPKLRSRLRNQESGKGIQLELNGHDESFLDITKSDNADNLSLESVIDANGVEYFDAGIDHSYSLLKACDSLVTSPRLRPRRKKTIKVKLQPTEVGGLTSMESCPDALKPSIVGKLYSGSSSEDNRGDAIVTNGMDLSDVGREDSSGRVEDALILYSSPNLRTRQRKTSNSKPPGTKKELFEIDESQLILANNNFTDKSSVSLSEFSTDKISETPSESVLENDGINPEVQTNMVADSVASSVERAARDNGDVMPPLSTGHFISVFQKSLSENDKDSGIHLEEEVQLCTNSADLSMKLPLSENILGENQSEILKECPILVSSIVTADIPESSDLPFSSIIFTSIFSDSTPRRTKTKQELMEKINKKKESMKQPAIETPDLTTEEMSLSQPNNVASLETSLCQSSEINCEDSTVSFILIATSTDVNNQNLSFDLTSTQSAIKWSRGDMFWARVTGHPWWPCLITDDPFQNVFTRVQGGRGRSFRQYHMSFFGDESERGWVAELSIIPFESRAAFEALAKKKIEENKKVRIIWEVKPTRLKAWNIAVDSAEKALSSSLEERIREYTYFVEEPIVSVTYVEMTDGSANDMISKGGIKRKRKDSEDFGSPGERGCSPKKKKVPTATLR